jgi:hypothetical protein
MQRYLSENVDSDQEHTLEEFPPDFRTITEDMQQRNASRCEIDKGMSFWNERNDSPAWAANMLYSNNVGLVQEPRFRLHSQSQGKRESPHIRNAGITIAAKSLLLPLSASLLPTAFRQAQLELLDRVSVVLSCSRPLTASPPEARRRCSWVELTLVRWPSSGLPFIIYEENHPL